MKKLLAAIVFITVAESFAASTNQLDAAERAHRRANRPPQEILLFGGYVTKPNSAKGKVVFLNAQRLIATSEFKRSIDYIKDQLHPEIALVDVDSVKLINPKQDIVKAGGKIGVVLADSPDLPMLVTAPEAGWSIVNVAALKDGDKDGSKLGHRVRVELLRAFGLAAGCAFMSQDPMVLNPHILIPEDLDMLKTEELGILSRYQIEHELPTHGVYPWKVETYQRACEEGWAHSPTNKYEKRIWDRVHAVPKNPMKIEFDKKAGR